MFASLLRPKKRRVYAERPPSPYTTREASWPLLPDDARHARPGIRYTEMHGAEGVNQRYEDGEDADEEEDGRVESTPLLPIFSASHLGANSPLHRIKLGFKII